MILVYTGNGKGKTEAAFGLALRAVGAGLKVAIVQFIKNEGWFSGEREAIKKFNIPIEIYVMGAGFSWEAPKGFPSHKKAAEEAWEKSKDLMNSDADLIICDEINVAMSLNMLQVDEVVEFIKNKREEKHICLTGRNAPQEIIKVADYVTDFVEIKHPFNKGIKAIKGIDY